MKFSIITVCYNCAATIRDTLRSVSRQSWADFEHVIVDGCSSDGTAEIVRELAGPTTRFRSEPDLGIYDAMNKGVLRAHGDVICFLNADDHYHEDDVLEEVARSMCSEPLDVVFGDVGYFRAKSPTKIVRRYDSGQFSPEKLGRGWMPAHPAMFVRREVFERVGLFRTDYRIAGDFEWVVRAFRDGGIRYRHRPQIFVRMRVGGVSTQGIKSTIRINREILRACRENGIASSHLRLLSKYPSKLKELIVK